MPEKNEKDPDRVVIPEGQKSAPSSQVATKKATAKTKKEKNDRVIPEEQKPADPKVSDAVVKIGKKLLAANPAMAVVYMTSDGCGFYSQNDAANHARTLTNKAVTPVNK